MEGEFKRCKQLMKTYRSNEVNCTTCKHKLKCQAWEREDFANSRAFDVYKRLMEDAKDIRLD